MKVKDDKILDMKVSNDLTNKETFVKMNKWIKNVKDNAPKDIVIMVVGNKSDLIAEKANLGDELTPFKNEYLYREVSAKNGNNVSLAFEELTHKIYLLLCPLIHCY